MLASLNHPNIAQIHGIEGEEEGTRALVLELVEGPTLADQISTGPIPFDEALPIAKQIAEALEAAHEAGVIHRDLKPANIKVREDGTVKVLDFGLAKALDPSPTSDPNLSPTLTAAATQMGVIMGTASYMSPEQARAKPVDRRTDIWAFGAVLFEMLTGTRPFPGDDVSQVLARVIERDPDWEALPASLPSAVDTYLRRCLQREPRQRVQAIGDVRLALEGSFDTTVSSPGDHAAAPQRRFWQRPVSAAATALFVAGIAGLVGWNLRSPLPARVARFPIPLAAGQSFTYTGRPLVAISPDGAQVVYTTGQGLWLRPLDQLLATQIPGTVDGRGPFFSPDGSSVGFWSPIPNQLRRVSLSGGTPVTIADVPDNPTGATWGPDDTILFGQPDGIMQVLGTGGTPALLIAARDGEVVHGPQMLPDNEWVLFTVRGDRSWDEGQIVAESVTTSERTLLIDGGRDARYLPTGHLLYGLDDVIHAVPFDADTRRITGRPVPLIEGVFAAVGNPQAGAMHVSISADGSLVYVPSSAGTTGVVSLVWVDRNGEETVIPSPARQYVNPRVSPDGTRVAVGITDDNDSNIWIWHLERETLTQFTFDGAVNEFPLWTPDGTRLVFGSARDGGGVYWKAADGTGQVERLTEEGGRPYAWSADGRLILEQQPGNIGVLTLDGERTVEMLLDEDHAESQPALSPDGRWLIHQSGPTGQGIIYVQPFPAVGDGKWLVSPSVVASSPVWSPDGRELFFATPLEVLSARVETEPSFTARAPEPLFDVTPYAVFGGGRQFDIAPDGNRFIFRKPAMAGETGEDEPFNGIIFVENWLQELTERVPVN